MRAFDYGSPEAVSDIAPLLEQADDPIFLGGGQTLLPTIRQGLTAPGMLISLKRLSELRFIRVSQDALEIGAMTTHATVAESAEVRRLIPGLAALAGRIADRHVRNRGTLGGSVANNDPAADYPAALLALGASVKTTRRTLSAEDFFEGLFTTALEENELVLSVSFPLGSGFSYQKFINPASRYAVVGVGVARAQGGVVVAVTGAGDDGVFRWGEAEERLSENFSAASITEIEPDASLLMSDLHASASYRATLVRVLAGRTVRDLEMTGYLDRN